MITVFGGAKGRSLYRSPTTQKLNRSDSFWNTPVGAGAATTAIPAKTNTFWLDNWNPVVNSHAGISVPVYFAKTDRSDPLQNVMYSPGNYTFVNTNGFLRWGNTSPNETTIKNQWVNTFGYATNAAQFIARYQSATQNAGGTAWTAPSATFHHRADATSLPRQVYVPADSFPASGTDGHIAIVQPDGQIFEAIQVIQLTTGEITCFDYSFTDPLDYGDGWNNGATTCMVPNYAGAITGRDIARSAIDHALHLTITPDNLASSIVYPALTFDKDGGVTGGGHYTGSCPMGCRLIIPSATNIGGHTFGSTGGPIIAAALQTYGGFVLDRGGGTGSLQAAVESNYNGEATGAHGANWTTWSAAFEADLLFIWQNWLVRATATLTNPRP